MYFGFIKKEKKSHWDPVHARISVLVEFFLCVFLLEYLCNMSEYMNFTKGAELHYHSDTAAGAKERTCSSAHIWLADSSTPF